MLGDENCQENEATFAPIAWNVVGALPRANSAISLDDGILLLLRHPSGLLGDQGNA